MGSGAQEPIGRPISRTGTSVPTNSRANKQQCLDVEFPRKCMIIQHSSHRPHSHTKCAFPLSLPLASLPFVYSIPGTPATWPGSCLPPMLELAIPSFWNSLPSDALRAHAVTYFRLCTNVTLPIRPMLATLFQIANTRRRKKLPGERRGLL